MTKLINSISFKKECAEFIYAQNQCFQSCKHGGDLNELDAFLLHLYPEIDFDQIDCKIARRLEKKIYRISKRFPFEPLRMLELENFTRYLKQHFSKKPVKALVFSPS